MGLKHVKLDHYIGYCSSQVFIILLHIYFVYFFFCVGIIVHHLFFSLFQYLSTHRKCHFLFYVLALKVLHTFHIGWVQQASAKTLNDSNCSDCFRHLLDSVDVTWFGILFASFYKENRIISTSTFWKGQIVYCPDIREKLKTHSIMTKFL